MSSPSRSWGLHDLPDGRCSSCGVAVKFFVGKAIDPPSRTPSRTGTPVTPPPPPQRERGEGSGRTVTPPPLPAQQRMEGGGYVGPPLSALERALAAEPKRTLSTVEIAAGPRRTYGVLATGAPI